MANILTADVLPEDKREGVDRMVKFIAIFHGKYFATTELQGSIGAFL